MNTVGIIVEYNPLHNGHVYHCQMSKQISNADAVIAVMSGHFLQRGEPALVNKWARAEMALRAGIDLVIELPVVFAPQPAEWFAYGAVSALEATGVVDSLCFGSEAGSIEGLIQLAEHLHQEPDAFQAVLKESLKQGISYPEAYSLSVDRWTKLQQIELPYGFDPKQLAMPNNSLGLYYIMALKRLNSSIRPLTISRTKSGYNQSTITDKSIASATALRKLILEQGNLDALASYVPATTLNILKREWEERRAPISWDRFLIPLMHQVISRSEDQLAQIYEINEGLEYRITQAISSLDAAAAPALQFESLLQQIKTKRYTRTKLQRALLRILLNHTKQQLHRELLQQGVQYLRVLGFTSRGRELLKMMKKKATCPIITNVNRDNAALLEYDIQATSIYALSYAHLNSNELLRDYYAAPVIIK